MEMMWVGRVEGECSVVEVRAAGGCDSKAVLTCAGTQHLLP